MKELVLDVECTTHNKGNPFDSRNRLVSIHAYNAKHAWSYCSNHNHQETSPNWISELDGIIDSASLIIGFNWKFDYTWLKKQSVSFPENQRYWDVQLAHFMLRYQTTPFPSLNDVLTYYGLPLKHDKVAELWKQGVQTDDIEWEVLCEYGEYDVQGTYDCYLRQLEEFKKEPQLYKLFKLCMMDQEVLSEMEGNGLKYNSEKCYQKAEELQADIDKISSELAAVYSDVPINFNSPDQLSAFLYGGQIVEEVREVIGFYKTGQKTGQPRFRVSEKVHQLPRLFTPIKGSEMAKEGIFSTAEENLKKLKGKQKWIIDHLLNLAKLDKLKGTYYEGLNKINAEMHWPEDMLHGQYNQCTTRTGRLSSSKPNQQNLSGDVLEIFESRFNS